MNDIINTSIEILGKLYPIRCTEAESTSLQKAASYLNEQMMAVQSSGKVINLERIAIITALNITHELLALTEQQTKITQKITHIQEKLETAMSPAPEMELIYTAE